MDKETHILEYLHQELKCDYISYLGSPTCQLKAKEYFKQAPMNDYPLEAWECAYHYILDKPSGATTIQEICAAFLVNL